MCAQDELDRMIESELRQAGVIGKAIDIIIGHPKCKFCGKFMSRFGCPDCYDADREDRMNEISYNRSR